MLLWRLFQNKTRSKEKETYNFHRNRYVLYQNFDFSHHVLKTQSTNLPNSSAFGNLKAFYSLCQRNSLITKKKYKVYALKINKSHFLNFSLVLCKFVDYFLKHFKMFLICVIYYTNLLQWKYFWKSESVLKILLKGFLNHLRKLEFQDQKHIHRNFWIFHWFFGNWEIIFIPIICLIYYFKSLLKIWCYCLTKILLKFKHFKYRKNQKNIQKFEIHSKYRKAY